MPFLIFYDLKYMGKIHNLKQELSTIENTVADFSKQLREHYSNYLNLLSQSVYKQLILATYQVCTQSYPQEFLSLSYSQQQKTQEEIKNLARLGQEKIVNILEKSDKSLNQSEENETRVITNPELLIQWNDLVESEINQCLDRLSMKINHLLQRAKILPHRLPSQVIEMAIRAEEVGQAVSGTPNILNVLVEAERQRLEDEDEDNEEEDQGAMFLEKITRLSAIRLRLIEIEFADSSLSLEHSQIRKILERINQVQKHYHRKQRECAIAEAESAWRACWTES